MGLFSKSRKSIILDATTGLSNLFFSKILEQGRTNKISKYKQNVLAWVVISAKNIVNSLITSDDYPLNKISDNQLGVEGNALNAYYKMSIFLLYIHDQRLKNKKELRELADAQIDDIVNSLEDLFSLKKGYVNDYINYLKELQAKNEDNTLAVIQYQMVEATKDLMADSRKVNELFDNPQARLILPFAFEIQFIEYSKALDKILGLVEVNDKETNGPN